MSLKRLIGEDYSKVRREGPDSLKSRFRREIARRNERLPLDDVQTLLPYAASGILIGTLVYMKLWR